MRNVQNLSRPDGTVVKHLIMCGWLLCGKSQSTTLWGVAFHLSQLYRWSNEIRCLHLLMFNTATLHCWLTKTRMFFSRSWHLSGCIMVDCRDHRTFEQSLTSCESGLCFLWTTDLMLLLQLWVSEVGWNERMSVMTECWWTPEPRSLHPYWDTKWIQTCGHSMTFWVSGVWVKLWHSLRNTWFQRIWLPQAPM